MTDPIKDKDNDVSKPASKSIKKTLQADLVKAVKAGDFKKSARIRASLKNLK